MEKESITFERRVKKEEEGKYLLVPFTVPKGVESMEVCYTYEKRDNIVDFGLMDEKGEFIGWSGSNRSSISISNQNSSLGFAQVPAEKGIWNILLGAYHIAEEGVTVLYHVTYQKKYLRIFKGDTHVHSCGSDGNMTTEELAFAAEKEGLDYLFITDHNNFAHNETLRSTLQVTMIPGVEWTHYKGHVGMLGRKRPFRNFLANSLEEAKERLAEAKAEGAFVVINHPFCPDCGFYWGMDQVIYDAVEVWNGALMAESNQRCLNWWDEKLKEGNRIPITGGSDFHRYEFASMPAAPCTCVYAMSNMREDILHGLKCGHSFLTLSQEGPMLLADADGKTLGDILEKGSSVEFTLWNLKRGDKLRLITEQKTEEIFCEDERASFVRKADGEKYLRLEIWRSLAEGMSPIPVLISNPLYIEVS